MAQPPSPTSSAKTDVDTEAMRPIRPSLRDKVEVEVKDVGLLRHLWHNFGEVAPRVYRSNHPGARRLRAYKSRGIKAILNLRNEIDTAPLRLEQQACAALGMEFHNVRLSARRAPKRAALLELFGLFDTLPKPFLMHCKSGADRAGLASALYLLDQTGADVETARQELSFRYLHIRRSATGILDHLLDAYAARLNQGPIPIRQWVAQEYDRDALIRAYEGRK